MLDISDVHYIMYIRSDLVRINTNRVGFNDKIMISVIRKPFGEVIVIQF